MVAKRSLKYSRRLQVSEVSFCAAARHQRHERQAEVEHKRDLAENGRKDRGGDREDEESDEDCFFESCDRIPSQVSFGFDLPSDSDDEREEEEVRISFSSAIGPPIDLHCVTHSREDFLAELREEEEDASRSRPFPGSAGGGRGGSGSPFDYDIWSMEDPMPIKERRRRLLHGMGFNSRKDFTASLRLKSMHLPPDDEAPAKSPLPKAVRIGRSVRPPLPPMMSPTTFAPQKAQEAAAPLADSTAEQQPKEEPLDHPAQLTRHRSESDLPSRQVVEDVPMRCASAPASLCDLCSQEEEEEEVGGEDEGGAVEEDGDDDVADEADVDDDEASPTKDQEEQKESAADETTKEGSKGKMNEFQSGIQNTMEEFERLLDNSPIVKELKRRVKGGGNNGSTGSGATVEQKSSNKKAPKGQMYKKKGGWFKNIKQQVATSVGLITEKDKADKADKAADAGAKAAGKAPGESSSELMKAHQHGKSTKELTGLYMSQEIDAHQGSIWSIKFSLDDRYLATAGEDRIVQVWQVQEMPTNELRAIQPKPDTAGLMETPKFAGSSSGSPFPPKKQLKKSKSKKRALPDYIVIPEAAFGLSEKPFCSFEGHSEDVLDLCWSKSSQHLLSSSMDKTVRLWDIETKSCIKLFVHNDFVTCIQFNPTDDRYFISGSLDAKVRIWNVPDRQVVDWTDLHEMVTAVSYTPDGQGAFVGSHKGNCRIYKISENKLSQESMIEIKSKKKKYTAKKITGLQFAPNSQTEVMITSADSRIRVYDDLKITHKYRGFRNISSQIAASYTSDGRYVVSASEDSNVYVWKREGRGTAGKGKAMGTTRSHENFFCKDVSVAIPWPSPGSSCPPLSPPLQLIQREGVLGITDAPAGDGDGAATDDPVRDISNSIGNESFDSTTSGSLQAGDAGSSSMSPRSKTGGGDQSNAWGLVVVSAGLGGQIRVFQNFGTPVRLNSLNKQPMY